MAEQRGIPDLEAVDLSTLKWETTDEVRASVEQMYRIVHEKAVKAIGWYWAKRKGRKTWAQFLRGLAVFFAALGLLLPTASLVDPRIPSELGYLMLVGVGACLLVNKVIGVSSGWIRYVISAMDLERALEEFQLRWAQIMARLGGGPENIDDVTMLLEELGKFAATVNQIVQQETESWAVEFQRDLAQLESMAQARVEQRLAPPTDGTR